MSLSTIMTDKVQNTTSSSYIKKEQQRQQEAMTYVPSTNIMKSTSMSTATLFDMTTNPKLDSPLFDTDNNNKNNGGNVDSNDQIPKLSLCGGCKISFMRKSVVIVNIINIIIVLGSLLCAILLKKLVKDHTVIVDNNGTTDIDLDADLVTFVQSIELSVQSVILDMIRFVCSILAIIGTNKENRYMVSIGAIMLFFDAMISLLYFNAIAYIECTLFLFPHYYYIQELQSSKNTVEIHNNNGEIQNEEQASRYYSV